MKKTTEDEIFDLPSDFDPKIYLLLHEDVKEAGMDPVRHYLDFGINENRPYRAPKRSWKNYWEEEFLNVILICTQTQRPNGLALLNIRRLANGLVQ